MKKSSCDWHHGAIGTLRLQMHSTDPVLAEPRLGTAQSEGCARIPATSMTSSIAMACWITTMNAPARGDRLWVLRKDRTPTPSPGCYMVVVVTGLIDRPVWSQLPANC